MQNYDLTPRLDEWTTPGQESPARPFPGPAGRRSTPPDSVQDDQTPVRAVQEMNAGPGDEHGLLDVDAAPSVLIVGRLDAKHHRRLQPGAVFGRQSRRLRRI